jgi:hypothetical protein
LSISTLAFCHFLPPSTLDVHSESASGLLRTFEQLEMPGPLAICFLRRSNLKVRTSESFLSSSDGCGCAKEAGRRRRRVRERHGRGAKLVDSCDVKRERRIHCCYGLDLNLSESAGSRFLQGLELY